MICRGKKRGWGPKAFGPQSHVATLPVGQLQRLDQTINEKPTHLDKSIFPKRIETYRKSENGRTLDENYWDMCMKTMRRMDKGIGTLGDLLK